MVLSCRQKMEQKNNANQGANALSSFDRVPSAVTEQIHMNSSIHKCVAGWWFQILFYFHPYLGKIPILTNIFQLG